MVPPSFERLPTEGDYFIGVVKVLELVLRGESSFKEKSHSWWNLVAAGSNITSHKAFFHRPNSDRGGQTRTFIARDFVKVVR